MDLLFSYMEMSVSGFRCRQKCVRLGDR